MKNVALLMGCAVLACVAVGAGCKNPATPAEVVPSGSTTSLSSQPPMQTWTFPGKSPDAAIQNKQVRIHTEKGDIVFKLRPDVAPITVSNFIYLTNGGFYNGLTFHRREEGFVIQGGDPRGNGTGGPGYNIPAEFNKLSHKRGMVAMARAMDPNSAGSQFYITLDDATFLDNNYTVFGEVISGMDVADQIKVGDKMEVVTIEDSK